MSAAHDLARVRETVETLAAAPPLVEVPKPLPPELLPVEAFPISALPNAFAPWVRDVAERMQCPADFVAVPLLVAAASLVARSVGIRPQSRTDWIERANLWALIVGRPGLMKSPAMSAALAPMDRLEAQAADEFNAGAAAHEAKRVLAKLRADENVKTARAKLKKDTKADVSALLEREAEDEEPARRRYVVNDATYEKLGEVLAQNPDGVLSVRDEMRGLLLHLAREESAQARGFFLQAWSGGRYTFDRIGRGTVTIEDARLSIIGGIQPGPLSNLMQQAQRGAFDDGMVERFLIAWPDVAGDWREVDRWPDSQARRSVWASFDQLNALTAHDLGAEIATDMRGDASGLAFLRFNDAAREAFSEWHGDLERRLRSPEVENMDGVLSKFRHHVPALALALHVIDGGVGPVTEAPTLRALALSAYFESHARRLHGSARRTTVRAARAILAKIRAEVLLPEFTARELHQRDWSGLTDRAIVGDALDMLASHGWLTEVAVTTGGRPTTLYSLAEGARHG